MPDLRYLGPHERLPGTERVDSQFWDLILVNTDNGNLPKTYPFSMEGSQHLALNAPPPKQI